MKRFSKVAILMVTLVLVAVLLCGCEEYEPSKEQVQINNAKQSAGNIVENQPVPTDMDYSLERYNVIRRAYWVNGQREKAMALPCALARPLGYIVLFSGNGSVVGRFVVDGKVSSLNSYLFPVYEQTVYGGSSSGYTAVEKEIAGIDGMYGSNVTGIFFFTTDGKYIEWTGDFLYSDIPFEINDPVLKYGEAQ